MSPTQNAINTQVTLNADGFDITGGTTGRKLTVTGANITLTGSGTAVHTFPATTSTLARTDAGQTFTGVQVMTSPTFTTSILPTTNDGCAIGAATTGEFSDIFLAEGGVINRDNGDVTLTQTGNSLALAGGDLALGANNFSSTGTVGCNTTTITSTNAAALTVGANGATNPALKIDASTASSATGLQVKSAAAAGGVAVTVLSSGTDENVTIDAKGSGTVTINATATGGITLGKATTITTGDLTVTNGDIVVSANAKKLSFTGTGANGGVLKNLKNAAASALSGTNIDIEIDIGGTPYYFTVYPTKA